jgi:hypothetical protein
MSLPTKKVFDESDSQEVRLTKILLDGYYKTLAELRRNQEYLDWYNNLGLMAKMKQDAFVKLLTPSAEQIIENYEKVFEFALQTVQETKNRNRLLIKKQWFDDKKERFFKLKKDGEDT